MQVDCNIQTFLIWVFLQKKASKSLSKFGQYSMGSDGFIQKKKNSMLLLDSCDMLIWCFQVYYAKLAWEFLDEDVCMLFPITDFN